MIRVAVLALVLVGCGDDGPATPPDGPADVPLDTPANTWTWVEIPGTTCANGTPAGFGVNRSTTSPDLFVLFQGGGACWDATSCFVAKTSIHIEDTYGPSLLASEIGTAPVDHTPSANPLQAPTHVYIPYCTGDLHAGTTSTTYDVSGTPRTVAHVGATNTQRFIDRLRSAFPDARTIYVAGISAGGYGATFNHHRFTTAWPDAEVHTVQDGSPLITPLSTYAAWRTSWDIAYPPGCTDCDTNLGNVMATVRSAHPTSRFALLHYDDDAVIKSYFGFAATAGSMVAASNALVDAHYTGNNAKAFMLAGGGHTMLGNAGTLTAPGGMRLDAWLLQWATGAPQWTTVRPN